MTGEEMHTFTLVMDTTIRVNYDGEEMHTFTLVMDTSIRVNYAGGGDAYIHPGDGYIHTS